MEMINKTIPRGDKKSFQWQLVGDHSLRKIIFVAKLTRGLTTARLIQKKNTTAGGNDTQLTAVYSNGVTTITAFLLPADTQDLAAAKYVYDITSEKADDATDHVTLFDGDLTITADVQTPTDGMSLPSSAVRFFVVSGEEGTAENDVLMWDVSEDRWVKKTLDEYLNIVAAANRGTTAQRPTTWGAAEVGRTWFDATIGGNITWTGDGFV